MDYTICLLDSRAAKTSIRIDLHQTLPNYSFVSERSASLHLYGNQQYRTTEIQISSANQLVVLQEVFDPTSGLSSHYLVTFNSVDSDLLFSLESSHGKKLTLDRSWQVLMAYFGPNAVEPTFVGSVTDTRWVDADGVDHSAEEVYDYVDIEKAFILGMHSMCPVFAQQDLADEFVHFSDSAESELSGSSQIVARHDGHSFEFFRVLEVYFDQMDAFYTENVGTVHLFNFDEFRSSQTNMDIDSFENTLEEDANFVAEIDEWCRDPTNFPNCRNGKFSPPISKSSKIMCLMNYGWEYTSDLCDYFLVSDSILDSLSRDRQSLKFGMNKRFVEPWFECSVI